jgi:hypothetical protein
MFDLNLSEADYQPLAQGINTFFNDWYDEQCRHCARLVSTTTQLDILEVMACLREPQASFASIREKLRTVSGSSTAADAEFDASITLAARLLFGISIGDISHSLSLGQSVAWTDGPVKASIEAQFTPAQGPCDTFKLPKVFNAANLERIAGIQVCWTSNLADHLLMKDDETAVMFFHHVTFLKLHKASRW